MFLKTADHNLQYCTVYTMKLVKNVRKMSTIPLQYSNFFDKIYYTELC